jgi:glycosyltransferase involved in cell wall biosynthesis
MGEMRVLWFSALPLPLAGIQGLTRAGWQEGLRKSLEICHPEVDLGIVVFNDRPHEPVKLGNATYYTFPRFSPVGRVGKIWKAWQHISHTPEELDQCIALVHSFSPDLVHFHGSENFFGLINSRLTVPAVLSIQGIVNGIRPYLFSDINLEGIIRRFATKEFIRGDGIFHKWLSWNKFYLLEQQILQSCQNFIGRTEWDRAILLTFNPAAHYYHCDEVLADLFYDHEWRAEHNEANIIYSTTSSAFFKGALILVRAISILDKRGYKNIQLRLAGLDPDCDLGKTIRSFAIKNKLEEKIAVLGRLPPQQILEEAQKASIFVLPSHIDNSPNSLCEAMLMGMPCIAAHVGGIPTLINDGVNGLLYHDRDPYILADKIIKLLDNRDLALGLGIQGRKTALIRHDRKKIADRTVEIYQNILSG